MTLCRRFAYGVEAFISRLRALCPFCEKPHYHDACDAEDYSHDHHGVEGFFEHQRRYKRGQHDAPGPPGGICEAQLDSLEGLGKQKEAERVKAQTPRLAELGRIRRSAS